MELLSHVKGNKGGRRFQLEPWQRFIVCNIFGWVKKSSGQVTKGKLLRRFRKAYIEVPKGNGKSFLISAIALYMLALDGERGAEVYSAATTKEQARVVFDVAQQMARNCPKFLAKYGVDVAARKARRYSARPPAKTERDESSAALEGYVAVFERDPRNRLRRAISGHRRDERDCQERQANEPIR